jgi:hypothetical protein
MVELIPKLGRHRALPIHNVLFYAALAVLVLVVAAYILLIYLESRASVSLHDLEGQITQVGTPAERQMERNVFATERKINDFSKIIEAHQKPSRFFPFLEAIVHPQVWFSNLELSVETNSLQLRGQTLNFRTLGEQLEVLRSQEMIREIRLADLSIGEAGYTDFSVGLTLDPIIFK